MNFFSTGKSWLPALLIILPCLLAGEVSISLPNTTANTGELVEIAVTLQDLHSPPIYSLFAELDYEIENLQVENVLTDSCITQNWSAPIYNDAENGKLSIAIFGSDSLDQTGEIFKIRFDVIAQQDTISDLAFSQFYFNEGQPQAQTSNGSITILHRFPAFDPVADVFALEGDFIEFDINATDPYNEELTLTAFALPEDAIFSDNGNGSAQFSWQTDQTSSGNYDVGFIAENESNFRDTLIVHLEVQNELNVWLPEIATMATDTIKIPIYTDNVSNLDVFSFITRISFRDSVITPLGISTDSTLTENWGNVNYNILQNEILLSAFDIDSLNGSGKLIDILFAINGAQMEYSELDFEYFLYNEGDPEVNVIDGILFLGTPEPYFEELSDLQIAEGDSLWLQVIGHDPLQGQLWLTAQNLPDGAVFWDNGDGTAELSWATDYSDGGVYDIEFLLTNEDSLSSQTNLQITVNNTSQPPYVQNPVPYLTFPEDTANSDLDLDYIFDDHDLNYGDSLVYSYTGNSQIAVNLDDANVLLTPFQNWFGTEYITFTATDLMGQTAQLTIQVEVTNVNDPPQVAEPLDDISFAEDNSYDQIDLNDVFFDIDGDQLTFSVDGNDSIQVMIDDGSVTLQPNLNWFGSEVLVFSASDDQDIQRDTRAEVSDTLQVTVMPINDPPVVISPMADIEIPQNTNYTTATLDDVFYDVDSPLTYYVQNNANIDYVLNPDNSVELQPQTDWFGVETLYFTAEDDSQATVYDIVQVKVTGLLLITEDFDHGGNAPGGWATIHSGTTGFPWQIVNDGGEDYSYRVENTILHTSNEKLISAVYDCSDHTDIQVSFWHDFAANANCGGFFQVSNDGFVWTTIESYTTTQGSNVSFEPGSLVNGKEYVQFRWLYTSSSYSVSSWNIDDLALEGTFADNEEPTQITDLSATKIDSNTVQLDWSACQDLYFSHYEIYISTDSIVTFEDEIWDYQDDPELQNISTNSTLVTDLSFNAHYWFAIRGVDHSGNAAELSNLVDVILADPPVTHSPYPAQNQLILQNSSTVEIGITFQDDLLVDASSLQYRIDSNGNGIYEESWQPIAGYTDDDEIVVRTFAEYNSDGDSLHFEFRGMDTIASGYSYSGESNVAGIEDDFIVKIDTTPPTQLEDLTVIDYGGSQIELSWQPTTELHFSGYEIFYNTHANIDTTDLRWNESDDPNLADIGTTSTIITGLAPDSLYWFRIRAADLAGNYSELSEEIISIPRYIEPVCFAPEPPDQPYPEYSSSRITTIGCTFYDHFGIEQSSVQYRFDANGNHTYDPEETWQFLERTSSDATLRNNNDTLIVSVQVQFDTDGDSLAFEFRAEDIDGYGPVYSGTDSQPGISDDWIVRIDSQPPTSIDAAAVGNVGSDFAEILWLVSSDENFVEYQVFYNTHPGITPADSLWDSSDDPNLANPGTGYVSSIVQNLQPATIYYFRVRAIDIAGNTCPLSMEVQAQTEGEFPPLPPEDLQITPDFPDITISWDTVNLNTNGEAISVSSYHIYAAGFPEFPASEDYKIATVADTFFVHQNILQSLATKVFYKITAEETVTTTRNKQTSPVNVMPEKLLLQKTKMYQEN